MILQKKIIYKTKIKIDQVHTFNMYKEKVKKVQKSSRSTIMYTHTQKYKSKEKKFD